MPRLVVATRCATYCLQTHPIGDLHVTRGFFFLILRKNFRGITFFASFVTPISVIKKSSSTQRKT
jgi:hypothetical protein